MLQSSQNIYIKFENTLLWLYNIGEKLGGQSCEKSQAKFGILQIIIKWYYINIYSISYIRLLAILYN